MKAVRTLMAVTMPVAVVLLSGCNDYVRRGEFEMVVGELRAEDEKFRMEGLRARSDMVSLRKDLSQRFAQYDSKITQVANADQLRLDMVAYFERDSAEIREEDKPQLKDFAQAIRSKAPQAVVTVEGSTDPSGPEDYNRWLAQQRAAAVREYLLQQGLPAERVRVATNRNSGARAAVASGHKTRDQQRRAALVVDLGGGSGAGGGQSSSSM